VPNDSKSQSDAPLGGGSIRSLSKALEHMGQEIGINADPGIAHFEPEATIRRRQHDGDMSARRSEL